jgi:WD40 repeat protein
MKRALGITLAVLLGVWGAAGGEEVPTRPFLRIETGMHTAAIWRIDTDAAGRFLVTGSEDKTVRVWDLASGQLLRTLRPPIGEGNEGKVYAVAMSPDGELVAAAGWTGYNWEGSNSIYLFERRSGRLLRRLPGLPEVIKDLAFSPDGSRLAATLGGAFGLRVFQMPNGRELGKDESYGNDGVGAAFAADGRLVTASFDGKIRLYDRDLHLLASASAPGGKRPYSVEFSPDGRKIAVGYEDVPHVDVLNASDLHSLYTPDARGTNFALGSIAWSADGTVLYAAGRFRDQVRGRQPIRRWEDAGRGAFKDLDGPQNSVLDLQALPNGRLAFGSADPAWGVLDANGKIVLSQRSDVAIFWHLNDGFRVDAGGSAVRFAYELLGQRPARFSLPERRIVLDPPQDPRLAPPRTSSPGVEVTGWEGTSEPRLAGQPVVLEPLEVARSLAIAPDGQSLLLGTEWKLRSYRRDGSLRWSLPGPGLAWAVNLSADGRLAVAGFSDGTIRWYRADNGRELLAFFPHADGKRWVLWTPGGYYDASVDGEDLIGWHVNNGPDRQADFFPAWQFRDRFRKPEVIDLVLATLDEAETVRRAGIRLEAQRPPEIQREELPPVATILDPADGVEVATPTVKVRVNVRSPSGKPVTRVSAKVDGQPVESRAAEFVPAGPQTDRDFERDLEVPLPPGDHTIEAVAEVAGRASAPAGITVKRKAQAPPTIHRLFALVAGIAEYAKAEYKLGFADDDARAIAGLLRGQKDHTFGAVEIRELVDGKATLSALLEGLQWLDDNVGPEDTAVVFFAGHGTNDREYFFLPYDADLARPVVTMLSQSQLQGVLTRLRGRVLLFLDTCRAGAVFGGSDDERRRKVDVTALLNSLTYSQGGLVVFSAAQGRELSQERADWGHGAFTKALLEALQGAADANRNGEITIAELDSYLTDRVRELTGGAQTPIQTKPPGVPIFTFIKVTRP